MFTARAATTASVISETDACNTSNNRARDDAVSVSVALNAVDVLNAKYK